MRAAMCGRRNCHPLTCHPGEPSDSEARKVPSVRFARQRSSRRRRCAGQAPCAILHDREEMTQISDAFDREESDQNSGRQRTASSILSSGRRLRG